MGARSSRRWSAARVDPPLCRRMQTYPPQKEASVPCHCSSAPPPPVQPPRGHSGGNQSHLTERREVPKRLGACGYLHDWGSVLQIAAPAAVTKNHERTLVQRPDGTSRTSLDQRTMVTTE